LRKVVDRVVKGGYYADKWSEHKLTNGG